MSNASLCFLFKEDIRLFISLSGKNFKVDAAATDVLGAGTGILLAGAGANNTIQRLLENY